MLASDSTTQRFTALYLLLYVAVTIFCYNALAIYFDFPDILRVLAEKRFLLFKENQMIILCCYYGFMLTGLFQMGFSIGLYLLTKRDSLAAMQALIFGILAGLFQIIGYLRWVVAVPYLTTVDISENVLVSEGLFNNYFGKGIGEHLGNLFLVLWLFSSWLVLKGSNFFNKTLNAILLISAILMTTAVYEPLLETAPLAFSFTAPAFATMVTWMLLTAYALMKLQLKKSKIPIPLYMMAIILWLVNVIPGFLGGLRKVLI